MGANRCSDRAALIASAATNNGCARRVPREGRQRVAAGRCRQPVGGSTQPGEESHSLSEGLGDLADELSPAHVHSPVDLAGLRSRVVFEDFHHQGRVVRDDDARL